MATCFYCLGTHNTSQCLGRATDRIIEGQAVAAQSTARAIEKLGYQLNVDTGDNIASDMENIQAEIQELHEFLRWSQAEVVWRMEKQIELLTGIRNILNNPRATQANELYKMGAGSLRRGRVNDALPVLLEARDLNPGDYRILMSLGHVFVQTDSLGKAGEAFQAAADYARSPNYKRDALLLRCRTCRTLGEQQEAVRAAREAVNADRKSASAHYELACAMAGYIAIAGAQNQKFVDELVDSLHMAINADRRFYVAASVDRALEPIRDPDVNDVLGAWLQVAEKHAEKAIEEASRAVSGLQELSSEAFAAAQEMLGRALEAVKTRTYFGYLDGELHALKARRVADEAATRVQSAAEDRITYLEWLFDVTDKRLKSPNVPIRAVIEEEMQLPVVVDVASGIVCLEKLRAIARKVTTICSTERTKPDLLVHEYDVVNEYLEQARLAAIEIQGRTERELWRRVEQVAASRLRRDAKTRISKELADKGVVVPEAPVAPAATVPSQQGVADPYGDVLRQIREVAYRIDRYWMLRDLEAEAKGALAASVDDGKTEVVTRESGIESVVVEVARIPSREAVLQTFNEARRLAASGRYQDMTAAENIMAQCVHDLRKLLMRAQSAMPQLSRPIGWVERPDRSEKSRVVAGVLGILLGSIGAHRFYLGHIGVGFAQIGVTFMTFGVGALWGFIEGIIIITNRKFRDAEGKLLRHYNE